MNDITNRFIGVYTYLLEHKKVSNPSHFAKMIEISTSMMNEILKGRSNAGINPIQNTVKTFTEINADWLLTGKGNKIKKESIDQNSSQIVDLSTQVFHLSTENSQLKETNELLRFKIGVLEKELSEAKYSQRDPIIYKSVAESEPELIKKKTK